MQLRWISCDLRRTRNCDGRQQSDQKQGCRERRFYGKARALRVELGESHASILATTPRMEKMPIVHSWHWPIVQGTVGRTFLGLKLAEDATEIFSVFPYCGVLGTADRSFNSLAKAVALSSETLMSPSSTTVNAPAPVF